MTDKEALKRIEAAIELWTDGDGKAHPSAAAAAAWGEIKAIAREDEDSRQHGSAMTVICDNTADLPA